MCSCALTLTCRLCLQEPYFSSVTRVRRAVCSCVVLLIFGGAAAAGLCYMLAHMKGSDPMAPRWVLDLCVALLMQLINRAGGRLAARLTAWENYRTDAAHAKALVYKTCLVQFLPSYLPLAFVAFAMASAEMHRAVGLEAEQNCVPVERDGDGVFRPSCIHELAAVVPVVLVVHVLAWLLEVGLTLWLDRPPQRKRGDQLPLQAEAEAAMPRSDGVVFAGYNNLALQFGWVAFFGAAWPLAGAVAACSLLAQVRLNARGFVGVYQRPAPQGCRGIGAWRWVFVMMGGLAVASNAGLIFFSSNWVDRATMSDVGRVTAFLVTEHAGWGLLALSFALGAAVPAAAAEQLHARRHQLKLYLGKLRRLRDEAAWRKVKGRGLAKPPGEDGPAYPYVESEEDLWAQHPLPGRLGGGGGGGGGGERP